MKRTALFAFCLLTMVQSLPAQVYVSDMIDILASRMNDPDKRSIPVVRYLDALNLAQESLVGLLPAQALVDLIHTQIVTSFPSTAGDMFKGGIYKKFYAGNDNLFGQWVDYDGEKIKNIGQQASHIVAVKRNGYFTHLIKSMQSSDWNETVLNNATALSPVAMEMSLGILVRPECTTGDTLSIYFVIKPRRMAYPLTVDSVQFGGRDTTRIKAFTTATSDRHGGWAKYQNLRNYTNKHNYYIRKHVDKGLGGWWFTVNDTLISTTTGWGLKRTDVCGLESDLPPAFHPLIIDMAEALLWSQENKNPEAALSKMSEIKFRLELLYAQYSGARAIENQ